MIKGSDLVGVRGTLDIWIALTGKGKGIFLFSTATSVGILSSTEDPCWKTAIITPLSFQQFHPLPAIGQQVLLQIAQDKWIAGTAYWGNSKC